MRSASTVLLLSILLTSLLFASVNIHEAKASGTIYIRADGSVDPPTAPMQRDGDLYRFTDDIASDYDGIVVEKDNIVIDGVGCMLQGTRTYPSNGVDLTGRTNVTIQNTCIRNFTYGIMLHSSSNNSISGNTMTSNALGICLESYSSHNSISGNTITANNLGILIEFSSSNHVSANNVTANNAEGIWLHDYSSHNDVSDNTIAANTGWGVEIWGYGVAGAYSSNYNNVSGNTITSNHGGIHLEHASNNSVSGNSITTNTGYGVEFDFYSKNNSVSSNTIANNAYGVVSSYYSDYNSVSGNTIADNAYGIYFSNPIVGEEANYNVISGNCIANNSIGIGFNSSSRNLIVGNCIANSTYGLVLTASSDNRFYHNNFIDNSQQAAVDSSSWINVWDDGYPSGGNYWSDYTYIDSCRGQYQNETGSDGVWDFRYMIDREGNEDRYPLAKPYGGLACDVDSDCDVDIFDIVHIAGVYGVNHPDPRYSRLCDMDLNGDIDIFDIVTAAGHYGQSW